MNFSIIPHRAFQCLHTGLYPKLSAVQTDLKIFRAPPFPFCHRIVKAASSLIVLLKSRPGLALPDALPLALFFFPVRVDKDSQAVFPVLQDIAGLLQVLDIDRRSANLPVIFIKVAGCCSLRAFIPRIQHLQKDRRRDGRKDDQQNDRGKIDRREQPHGQPLLRHDQRDLAARHHTDADL